MKIISGGQTGADRAGLEVARECGLPTGGTAPRGWRTEDGPDPSLADFGLREHASSEYPPRTEVNVRDSDGTVIFGNLERGSALTIRLCKRVGRPYITNPSVEELVAWITLNKIETLNVAGNRRSRNPGVVDQVRATLGGAFRSIMASW